jgi:hypothetical protein
MSKAVHKDVEGTANVSSSPAITSKLTTNESSSAETSPAEHDSSPADETKGRKHDLTELQKR